MKKITLLLLLLVSSVIYSQTNGITYQAVIFNPNGGKVSVVNNTNVPLANKKICLQFTIVDAASKTEYQETINTTTDEFGMVNTIIGSGNQSGGYALSFSDIYWSTNQKSLKVALDINGKCSNFVEISNQAFTSVPSAFSALNAENVTGIVPIKNGGTNAITVLGAKTNLALENVDNTSDLNKPISLATQTELNLKENSVNKSIDVMIDGASNVKYPTVKAVKTYVDANSLSGSVTIATEVSRATTAETTIATNLATETARSIASEGTLTTNLVAEVNRAAVAEGVLTTNIANEATTRGTADATLTTNLNAEVTRATTAEATKENAVNKSIDGTFTSNSDVKFPTEKAVKTYVDASASSGSAALTTEINRAIAAEGVLATNLNSEAATRLANDNTLTTSIDTEATTRGTAVTTLTTNLSTEVNRATAAEGTLTTNLAAEVSRATTAENVVTGNLATENTRALAAEATKENTANKSTDGTLASNSDVKFPTEKAVKTYVDASASTGSAELNTEINRATAAEGVLTTSIANEATTRGTADSNLTTNLNAEVTRATAAETANTNAITAEATTARAAELTNANAITTEATRALTAEATKENMVNKSIDGTFTTNSDVKFPTEKAVKTYVDANASTASTALTAEINRATVAEGVLTTSITTEASTRGTTDVTLTTNLNAEVTRATAAETTNTNAITAEGTTARAAELANASAINTERTRALAVEAGLASNLALKVDKVTGKDLSANDYTDAEKTKLAAISGTNTGDQDLTALATTSALTTALNLKVDKVSGKDLSANDYTDAEKTKLAAIAGTNTGDQDLSTYAPLASPTFTGTVSGITKTMVALANVDNTSDVNKPVSTATQTALNLKAPLESPTLTGIPISPTATAGTNTTQIATTEFVTTAISNAVIEVVDEFAATAAQASFTLTQTPSANSKVKMYVNGIRISNNAYSWTSTTLTYYPANNGAYALTVNDRIQFDYFYNN
ncbi:MAG: hypothetical protein H7Y10_00745 [Flavobacterium sp.]|nr:hypothetical protein [Flavobacterium sp.]